MISKKYIKDQVTEIDEIASYDPERAHSLEDRLYYDVMKSISEGDWTLEEIQSRVNTALQTKWIDFPRWAG